MKNTSLVTDYITRAEHRLAALQVLAERQSWADVVRESQEIVELCLEALLRSARSEDLTPSELYEERDGRTALEQAEWVFHVVRAALAGSP